LLDLNLGGRARKVLVRPERNGYMYVIDRETGHVLSADAYGTVNSTLGVDLESVAAVLEPQADEDGVHTGAIR